VKKIFFTKTKQEEKFLNIKNYWTLWLNNRHFPQKTACYVLIID
jgi:hypothetical protein